jgi:glycerol-3-phosphate acyltransferase PlsY
VTVALLLLPVAYLLGTFPSAVWVARAKGVDILAVGSGNPGASNVARTVGNWWGVLVFALDAAKGAIPAAAGLLLDTRPGAYALVAAAVLGHMFPATRRFRGGKGVATMGGATVVLHTIVFAVLLVIWLVVRKATGKASLGSIAIAIGLPVGVAVKGAPAWELLALVGLALLVMLRHLDNIRRLLSRSELSARRS